MSRLHSLADFRFSMCNIELPDPRAKNPEVFSSLSFGLSWAFGSTANIRLIKHLAEAPLQGFWVCLEVDTVNV